MMPGLLPGLFICLVVYEMWTAVTLGFVSICEDCWQCYCMGSVNIYLGTFETQV